MRLPDYRDYSKTAQTEGEEGDAGEKSSLLSHRFYLRTYLRRRKQTWLSTKIN